MTTRRRSGELGAEEELSHGSLHKLQTRLRKKPNAVGLGRVAVRGYQVTAGKPKNWPGFRAVVPAM